jgi:hypothetical protein
MYMSDRCMVSELCGANSIHHEEPIMLAANEVPPVVNEEIWNAWVARSKLREQRTADRIKRCGGIAVSIVAIAVGLYSMK